MKKLRYFTIGIIAVFIAACQKLDVEPVDGTPVFFIKAEVDGIEKSWEAGVNDYYMFTSFVKDSNDVHTFSGHLRQQGCTTSCGESLSISIRDFRLASQGNTDVGLALKTGDYFFKRENMDSLLWKIDTTVFYTVNFNASNSIGPPLLSNFTWNFGGLGSGSGPLANFVFSQLDQPIPVTLSMASSNVCSSTQTRLVQKNSPNTIPCGVQITVQADSTGSATLLTAMPTGFAPFSYTWSNGGSGDILALPFNPQQQATVTITDGTGCTSTASVNFAINPGTVPQYCSAAFSYNVDELIQVDSTLVIFPGDSLQFSKLTIEFTDAMGRFFRSDGQPQPAFSFFKILSSEAYNPNENGEKTQKLGIRFSCRMWDGQGNFIDIKNGEAVIAVAYP